MTVEYLDAKKIQGQTYNSASFDGTDDGAVVSNAIFNGVTGDFTVAFWFYADTNADTMMGSYDTGTPNWQIYFSGNEIKISDGSVHVIPEMDFTVGTWYHMAWVRTSGSLQCFINGVVEDIELSTNLGSFASSQTWTQTLDGNNDTFTFGQRGDDDKYFDGKLAQVIFLTEALSQADITTLQTKTAISVTTMANANLQGYYPFTSNFNDSSDQGRNATASGATIVSGSGQPDDKATLVDQDGTNTTSNTSNSSVLTTTSGASGTFPQGLGFRVDAGHALVGTKLASVTTYFGLNNLGSDTDMKAYHWNGSTRSARSTSTEAVDTATLVQSGAIQSKTWNFATPAKIVAGDYITLELPTSTGSGTVFTMDKSNYTTNLTTFKYVEGTGYTELTGGARFTATVKETNLPENTIFNETDTYRQFWLQDNTGISKSGCLGFWQFQEQSGDVINHATTANGFPDGLGSAADGVIDAGLKRDAVGKFRPYAYEWLDGSVLSVDVPDQTALDITGDITITMWIYPTEDYTSNGRVFMAKRDGTTTTTYQLFWHSNNLMSYYNGTTYNGTMNASGPMTLDAWNFIAITISSNTLTIYLNGYNLGTHTVGTRNTNSAPLTFGQSSLNNTEDYAGRMQDCTIWNRALSEAEITAMYNSNRGVIDMVSGVGWYY